MDLSLWDGVAFAAFLITVIGISLYASRKEKDSEDYFLAGRSLTWWLIGISLIASNISTEHFVGMAGAGFGGMGLAVASYEWIAAIALIVMGFVLLPIFLRLGIYTMPEFLEHRFGKAARSLMATYMMVAYVGVVIVGVLYSGALGLQTIFGLDLTLGIWTIGFIAGAYTIYGGLKAVVWSDLIQGIALLLGGTVVMFLGFDAVGGIDVFMEQNADKLHVVLPKDHPDLPWTALLLGIWIPNMFYWSFNQFITQRTLGAKSLKAGQRGIVLAAAIKLVIPFIIVFPGIMAYQLYGSEIPSGDMAYAVLIKNLLPAGLRGIMFAALFGAVMSSLDSMLNSASTIFTMDIYKQHIRPNANPQQTLRVGRIATFACVIVGGILAPLPAKFEGVFEYIQLVWGFVSPGVVAVFFFGLVVRRAPHGAAVAALILGPILYGMFLSMFEGMAFLNIMAITFLILIAVMIAFTVLSPLPQPVVFKGESAVDLEGCNTSKMIGIGVVIATVVLYIIFW